MGKEKLYRLDVGHGDIQEVPLLPVHQAGRGQGSDLLKQGDPHGGQQLVGPGVRDHTLHIPSQHNEQGGEGHQPGKHPEGALHPPGAPEQQQSAKAHNPHLGQVAHNTGQGGHSQRPLYRGGDAQQASCHMGNRIGKPFRHGSSPPLPGAPIGPVLPLSGGKGPALPSAPGGCHAGRWRRFPAHKSHRRCEWWTAGGR